MSSGALNWAKEQPINSSARKLLLVLIADYADEAGSCFPGQALLSRQSGMSVRSVQRHVAQLESDGFLVRSRRHRKDGSRTSDRYELPLGLGDKTSGGSGAKATTEARLGDNRGSTKATPVSGHEPPVEPPEEPPDSRAPSLALVAQAADEPDPTFEDFWGAWPRKVAKGAARKAWKAACRRAPPAEIVEGAHRYATDPTRDPGFTCHPATWLNADRWADEGPVRPSSRRQAKSQDPISRAIAKRSS